MGFREVASPEELPERFPLERFEILLAEIRVDVDVEIQGAARIRGITIQEVANPFGTCQ